MPRKEMFTKEFKLEAVSQTIGHHDAWRRMRQYIDEIPGEMATNAVLMVN